MSARVNLLPPELGQRAREQRRIALIVGAVALWALLLGVLYVLQLGDLNDARQERDDARAEVARLETQVERLQEFAELDRVVTARNELLGAAMETELSWTRVLNDLALTFPQNASMVTFAGTTAATADATAGTPPPATSADSVASVAFEGYSVERYAPGVERVLVKFDEVDTFSNPYVMQANQEERANTEVTRFSGALQLNDEAYTRRYAEGLPAEPGR